MIVVDCSILISALLPDENNQYANEVCRRIEEYEEEVIVPFLFFTECFNTLIMSLRRNRINQYFYEEYSNVISNLPFDIDTITINPLNKNSVSQLCFDHNLTFYDALYLELSIRQNIPLATLDKALIKAANSNDLLYKL